jgi:Tfp pilus assembly protein PilF
LLRLARVPTERDPKNGTGWVFLGLAHYRAGDWPAASAALEEALSLNDEGYVSAWFLMAMTKHRLGQRSGAPRWYARAAEGLEQTKSTDEGMLRLRAEAASLLGIAVAPKSGDR